jgi:putative transposase
VYTGNRCQERHFLLKFETDRKKREGAYWTDHFHPTLIQNGPHFCRCLLYIGLNMVRTGAIKHPSDWRCCGYHEHIGNGQRYKIIDIERLLKVLEMSQPPDYLFKWYNKTIESSLKSGIMQRQAIWTECAAVGNKQWIKQLGKKEIIFYNQQKYQQENEKEILTKRSLN